jgi:hypothetical protein
MKPIRQRHFTNRESQHGVDKDNDNEQDKDRFSRFYDGSRRDCGITNRKLAPNEEYYSASRRANTVLGLVHFATEWHRIPLEAWEALNG